MSDILNSFFGADPGQQLRKRAAEKKESDRRNKTPIPQMRSKTVDGVKYVRAEDVVLALGQTHSWSRVLVHLQKWLDK